LELSGTNFHYDLAPKEMSIIIIVAIMRSHSSQNLIQLLPSAAFLQ
jgi:hypothetical protein